MICVIQGVLVENGKQHPTREDALYQKSHWIPSTASTTQDTHRPSRLSIEQDTSALTLVSVFILFLLLFFFLFFSVPASVLTSESYQTLKHPISSGPGPL